MANSSKKKVVLFCTNSDESGAPRHIEVIASSFSTEFDVTVILGGNGPVFSRLKSSGVSCFQLTSLKSTFGLIGNIKAFLDFRKIVNTINPDIIHCHSSVAGIIGRVYCMIYKKKCLFTVHGWGWRGFGIFKKLIIFSIEFFLANISNSNYIFIDSGSLNVAKRLLQIRNKAISFIPNGVTDLGLGMPKSRQVDYVLLMAARVGIAKDHETLVRAFELARVQGSLVLVGAGTENADFYDKISNWAPKKKHLIKLIGEVSEIQNYLHQASVYCLISNFEALPISIIEAMSSGLPILATDVGDCRELVVDSVNGYVTLRKDTLQLSRQIEELSVSDKRTRMGYNSRQIYLKKYTSEKMITQLRSKYLDLLKSDCDL